LLKEHPKRVDVSVLDQFPEFRASRTPKEPEGDTSETEAKPAVAPEEISSATPEEAIQVAIDEITKNLQTQLLDRMTDQERHPTAPSRKAEQAGSIGADLLAKGFAIADRGMSCLRSI
jgi:hypothetical protein